MLLVERTIVYDIVEQMSDADAALEHYSTVFDLVATVPAWIARAAV